jgi:hypothetical protein
MPFDPTYEIDDDTISIGDLVRAPGSGSDFIKDGETGTVIALGSPYTGPCHARFMDGIGANGLRRRGMRRRTGSQTRVWRVLANLIRITEGIVVRRRLLCCALTARRQRAAGG